MAPENLTTLAHFSVSLASSLLRVTADHAAQLGKPPPSNAAMPLGLELRPDLILTQNTPTTAAMLQQTRFAPVQAPLIVATGVIPFTAPGVTLSVVGGLHESVATRHADCVGRMAVR